MKYDFGIIIPGTKNGFKIKNYYECLPLSIYYLNPKKKTSIIYQKNPKIMVNYSLNKIFGILVNPRFSITDKYLIAYRLFDFVPIKGFSKKTLFKLLVLLEPFLVNLWKNKGNVIEFMRNIGKYIGKGSLIRNTKKDILCKNKKMKFLVAKIHFLFIYSSGLAGCVPFFRNFFLLDEGVGKFSNCWAICFSKILRRKIGISKYGLKNFLYIVLKRIKKKNLFNNFFPFFMLSYFCSKFPIRKTYSCSLLMPQIFQKIKKKKYRQKKFILSIVCLLKNIEIYTTKCSSKRLINNLISIHIQRKKLKKILISLFHLFIHFYFKNCDYLTWFCYWVKNFLGKLFHLNTIITKNMVPILIFFLKKLGLITFLKFLKKIISKKKNYTYFKLLIIKKFIQKKNIQNISSRFICNLFRYIFQKIRYSTKKTSDLPDLILLKLLKVIIKRYGVYFSHFLPKIIGLIKWILTNKKNFTKKIIFSFFLNIISIMNKRFPKNLVFHSSLILWENLNEKNSLINAKILKTMGLLLKFFNPVLFVPTMNVVIFKLLPLFKNRQKVLCMELVNFVSIILMKKSFLLPKKEALYIFFQILEVNKNFDKKIRKKCNICLVFLSKLFGPNEIVKYLINHLFKGNTRNCNNLNVNMLSISRFLNLNIVFCSLLVNYGKKLKFDSKIFFFKIFSNMIEFLPVKKISNFIHIIMILVEKFLIENLGKIHPILVTIVSQILLKHSSFIDIVITKRVVIIFLIEIFYKKKNLGNFFSLFLKNLIYTEHGILFFDYFILGSFSVMKKIRKIFWFYKNLIFKIILNSRILDIHFNIRKKSVKNILF